MFVVGVRRSEGGPVGGGAAEVERGEQEGLSKDIKK